MPITSVTSFDKANALVKSLGEKCNEKLTYYLDQKSGFISSINDQIVYNFQVLQNLAIISKNFNQTEISTQLIRLQTNNMAFML